jgi:integrase/recombinase XerD
LNEELTMVHELYEKVLKIRYMNYSEQSLFEALSVAKRLPPPEELTTEFLVDFLQQYDNVNTRSYYYYILKVICKEIGRPELFEPIPKPVEVSTVKRRDLLTPKDISALLRACNDLYERALIEVLVESGCRIGEIMNLTAEDITLDNHFLYLNVEGKTGDRQVPLLRDNIPSFQFHLAIHPEGYVFFSPKYPDRSMSYRAVLDRIVCIFERAGVRKRNRTIHIFRHTKATHLLELGVPEAIIKRFMGWSETSDMISNYTHLTSKTVKDYFSRLYGIETEPLEPLMPEEEREKFKRMFG